MAAIRIRPACGRRPAAYGRPSPLLLLILIVTIVLILIVVINYKIVFGCLGIDSLPA